MTGNASDVRDGALLTAKEVAARERVSLDMVKKALRHGRLIGYQVGGRHDWRIHESEYRAWVAVGAPTAKLNEVKE